MPETSRVLWGLTIAGIGVIVLLIGSAMPETITTYSTSCVDMGWYGNECYTAQITSNNPARAGAFTFGTLTILSGLIIGATGGNSGEEQ